MKSVQTQSYFWSVFPCIQSKYRKIRTRNYSIFGHFSRSEEIRYTKHIIYICLWIFFLKMYKPYISEAATGGALLEASNFIKTETLAQVFSCEFCEISKSTFFTEHVWATASVVSQNFKTSRQSKSPNFMQHIWKLNPSGLCRTLNESHLKDDEKWFWFHIKSSFLKIFELRLISKFMRSKPS